MEALTKPVPLTIAKQEAMRARRPRRQRQKRLRQGKEKNNGADPDHKPLAAVRIVPWGRASKTRRAGWEPDTTRGDPHSQCLAPGKFSSLHFGQVIDSII